MFSREQEVRGPITLCAETGPTRLTQLPCHAGLTAAEQMHAFWECLRKSFNLSGPQFPHL